MALWSQRYKLNLPAAPSYGLSSFIDWQFYLQNGSVEEQGKQLNEIEEDVAIFLLHPYDVGQGIGPLSVYASVSRGGPWEETELEKVLHYDGQLRQKEER